MNIERGKSFSGIDRMFPTILVLASLYATSLAAENPVAMSTLSGMHPARETRMAAEAAPGYVHCGVWRIQGPRNTLYLAALPNHSHATNQIPFPSAFYAAYHECIEVYIEVGASPGALAQFGLLLKAPAWVKSHQTELVYPTGMNLETDLAPATITALRAHYGKDYEKRKSMKPPFLMIMEELGNEKTKQSSDDIEGYFVEWAKKDRKAVRALDDQGVLNGAFKILEIMLLNFRLEMSQRGADVVVRERILGAATTVEMDNAIWRRGDLNAAEKAGEKLRQESSKLYDLTITQLNLRWTAALKKVLKREKKALVLIEIAHLAGKEGILQMLSDAGFTVEQMYGVDQP
jgi:uncharacterized protein YbaP (TraB family)